MSAAARAPADRTSPLATIALMGETLALHPAGALWWPAARTLVVADMHLEKGSAFAARGQMLPPYDSALTLSRLARLVAELRPARLIALGDTFHDAQAGDRLSEASRAAIGALAAGANVVWIAGNHDPAPPDWLPGERAAELRLGPFTFRHAPIPGPQPGEVAGHLHPAAKVAGPRGRLRRKAFVADGRRLLLPAFGAYAGGLNVLDPAVADLFAAGRITAHVCGDQRVYPVPERRLATD